MSRLFSEFISREYDEKVSAALRGLAECIEFIEIDNCLLKRIVTQKNSGLACARNTGLRYVTGEYVGFVDSDDWVDLKFFEKLYRYAKNYDADIAYADFVRKGKNKHKLRMKFSGVEVSENKVEETETVAEAE